jgi:hypothetical protein
VIDSALEEASMSRRLLIGLAAVALVLTLTVSTVVAAPPQMFVAPLSGAEEVPAVDTRARGVAIFQLSPDGSTLSFKLIASNIQNITQAHIHCCAGAGVNAGVSVFLYPDEPPAQLIPGRHSGVLVPTGTITSADIRDPDQLTDADDPLAALVEKIVAGDAYVNVHTSQFPTGEIRGQLP